MKYTVFLSQDNFTAFTEKKFFWFLDNAIEFAEKRKDNFDIIFITRFDEVIKVIKGE